ncbi:MAG: hypothetical protein GTO41_29260 [Burkholderiales bacterium]|nr:hypothetical protein [Burkholderiales bacterium]
MNGRIESAFIPVLLYRVSCIVATAIVAMIGVFSVAVHAHAENAAKSDRVDTKYGWFDVEGVSLWFNKRFSKAELHTYAPEDFAVEQHLCNCNDKPKPHYPYMLIFFSTPEGDLVGRPERRGFDTVIIPLAVRHGQRYCNLDAEDQCYGSFSDPCDFSDFRYGKQLAPYFPYCKANNAEPS